MSNILLEHHIIFYAMCVTGILGLVTRLGAYFSLRKMVREASRMGKSTHGLMKLVRAKFEHMCMISDKVQNVDAFVEKYIYESRILGIQLHGYQQLEKIMVWLCLLFGIAGSVLAFQNHGLSENVLRYGAFGIMEALFLFVLNIMIDENYQLDAAKMYMVDFLENFYARRYEKMNQKPISRTMQENEEQVAEQQVKIEETYIEETSEQPVQEVILAAEPEAEQVSVPVTDTSIHDSVTPLTDPRKQTPPIQVPEQIPQTPPNPVTEPKIPEQPIRAMDSEESKPERSGQQELIREILAEFLA